MTLEKHKNRSWGGRGRKFKSCHSDQNSVEIARFLHYFFAFLSKFYILLRSTTQSVTQFVTQICGMPLIYAKIFASLSMATITSNIFLKLEKLNSSG